MARHATHNLTAVVLTALVLGQFLAEVRSQVVTFAASPEQIEAMEEQQQADPADEVEIIRFRRGALDNVDKKKVLVGSAIAAGALAAGAALAGGIHLYNKHKNATNAANDTAEATTAGTPV